jgi:hypothetical protein
MTRWNQAYTQVVKSHRGTGKGRVNLAYWRMDEGLYAWSAWRGAVAVHGTAPSSEEAQKAAYEAALEVKVPGAESVDPLGSQTSGKYVWSTVTKNRLHGTASLDGFKLDAWSDGTWEVTAPGGKVTWGTAKNFKGARVAAEKAVEVLISEMEPT